MSISRADKGGFANWWFTVDKVALTTMGLLLSIGLMLAFAASPAITGGPVTAGDFHYAVRQLAFASQGRCRSNGLEDCKSLYRRSSWQMHGHQRHLLGCGHQRLPPECTLHRQCR